MPVVVCSACKVKINVKDEMIGKKAKCPKCAAMIVLRAAGDSVSDVPAPRPKPKPRPASVEDDNPFASFEAEPEPPKKAAPKRRPPPPPPEEPDGDEAGNPFATFESEPEPPKKAAGKRRAPEPDEDEDDPYAAFEPVEDDEAVSEKPQVRGKKKRVDDDDVEEKPRRGMKKRSESVSRRGQGGEWATARSGLRLVFFAVIGILAFFVMIQIASAAMGIMVGQAFNNAMPKAMPKQGKMPFPKDFNDFPDFPKQFPKGAAPAAQAGAGLVVISFLVMGFMGGIVICAITGLVGQVMCCFAPEETAARKRARISMIALIALIVIMIVGAIGAFALGIGGFSAAAHQAQANPNNPAAAKAAAETAMSSALGALCIMGTVGLIALVLGLVYHIFWILFHASVADHFGDKALSSHIVIFLVTALIVPFINAGIQAGVVATLMFSSPVVAQLIISVLNLIIGGGLLAWYLLINRRVVALIDDNT